MSTHRHIVCPHCLAANRLPAERDPAGATCGACKRPLFDGTPVTVDEAALARHVARNDIPVLVDVWAAWCGPCRAMAPEFARAAAALEPAVRLLKLDADAAPSFCAARNIASIPSLLLFRDGALAARTAGAMPAARIVQWARNPA